MSALVKDVVKGSIVKTTIDFGCIKQGAELSVDSDKHGLFIPCCDGHHYLDGQIDGDMYVNLELVK